MKKKVVFLGGKKVGISCLKYIIQKQLEGNYELVGVIPNKVSKIGDSAGIAELCENENIPIFGELDEIFNISNLDYIMSVQYNEILADNHISKPKKGAFNLHMAPLPEYRGCNQFSFAIMDEVSYFGTTLHSIDSGVDSGDIIFEKRFEISEDIWVEDLYELTVEASIELFRDSWLKIIDGDYTPVPQSKFKNKRPTSYHARLEIEELKKIDPSLDEKQILKRFRACYMPGYAPPYLQFRNKINLELHPYSDE